MVDRPLPMKSRNSEDSKPAQQTRVPFVQTPEKILGKYYRANVRLGVRGISRGALNWGFRRLWNPVDYWRCAEIPHAICALQPKPGERVLDIGSPKFAALFLAKAHRCSVHATDISDYFMPQLSFFSRLEGLEGNTDGELRLQIEDGRQLSYADETFDKVFSISVLEHIPGDGDTAAIRECARVLKRGGRVVITTNISHVHHDVTLVPRHHPEHFMPAMVSNPDVPHFFERRYDRRTLTERLIVPSGLKLVGETMFFERYPYYEKLYSRLPFRLKVPLLPLGIVLAKALIRKEDAKGRSFQKPFAVVLLCLEKAA
jgi:ubiquinone/menaquinone biosynthesis C-methylase UbiE